MKLKIEKAVLISLLSIGALLFTVTYAVLFAFEFVLLADLMGLEVLALFPVYQSRYVIAALERTTWSGGFSRCCDPCNAAGTKALDSGCRDPLNKADFFPYTAYSLFTPVRASSRMRHAVSN